MIMVQDCLTESLVMSWWWSLPGSRFQSLKILWVDLIKSRPSCLFLASLRYPVIRKTDTDIYSVILHRQKSPSCSSSWPPKTPRSSACRPSCWPKAAQPATAQREVRTAGSHIHICQSRSALITVPLSSDVHLTSSCLPAAPCCRGGVYQAPG